MSYIWLLILAYLAGAMPFGLLLAKGICHIDLRQAGSRNTGATNVARTCGLKMGIAVLVLDILKGYLPVALAVHMGSSAFFPTLAALAAILGHMYSVFLSGRGGKGVATSVGIFLALSPIALFWGVGVCLVLIYLTGFVSLGSLALVSVVPLVLLLTGEFGLLFVSVLIMGLVFWKHRENIDRLSQGKENSWRKENC
ncbi:MAG: glycerol-3-phosphate 1-O-acyltransferase PlsY [Desulfonatronovibrionaceae bacterium]